MVYEELYKSKEINSEFCLSELKMASHSRDNSTVLRMVSTFFPAEEIIEGNVLIITILTPMTKY